MSRFAFTAFALLAAAPALVAAAPGFSPNSPSASLFRRDDACTGTLPPSCSDGASPSGADSCCTNTPGGQLLQTQFWDTDPSTGPTDSWTVHGLWPDHCDGTYDSNCDPTRVYTNISAILTDGGASATLDYMNTYWKDDGGDDETFWEHEWAKHGTCISTLVPSCYGDSYVPQQEVVEFFNRTVALFQDLPTYTWLSAAGITPDSSATYTLAQLQAVANSNFGQDAVWNCVSGVLDEVWWGYTTVGTVHAGVFTPAPPVGSLSTCPDTGIQYLPKSG